MTNTPLKDADIYIQVNSRCDIEAAIAGYNPKNTFLYLLPSGAASMGMGVVWGHLEYLHNHHPAWEDRLAVDCRENAGYVLSALRHGVKVCVFSGPLETFEKLQSIAEQCGGMLHHSHPLNHHPISFMAWRNRAKL